MARSNSAGSLPPTVRDGLTEIRASGTARASSRSLLEQIRLTVERRGEVAYVIVETPELRGDWSDDDEHASLDLVVEVPKTLALDVEDRSGELEIRGVGSLDLSDNSAMRRSRTRRPSSCPGRIRRAADS